MPAVLYNPDNDEMQLVVSKYIPMSDRKQLETLGWSELTRNMYVAPYDRERLEKTVEFYPSAIVSAKLRRRYKEDKDREDSRWK